MLINSILSMILLATKMLMSKYCSQIVSRFTFIKLYFIGEFICAAIIILLSLSTLIQVPIETYIDKVTIKTSIPACVCYMGAEIFTLLALSEGPAGPVSAIISFNAVLVSILVWIITGIALSLYQIIGIVVAFAGIIIVAASKQNQQNQ